MLSQLLKRPESFSVWCITAIALAKLESLSPSKTSVSTRRAFIADRIKSTRTYSNKIDRSRPGVPAVLTKPLRTEGSNAGNEASTQIDRPSIDSRQVSVWVEHGNKHKTGGC